VTETGTWGNNLRMRSQCSRGLLKNISTREMSKRQRGREARKRNGLYLKQYDEGSGGRLGITLVKGLLLEKVENDGLKTQRKRTEGFSSMHESISCAKAEINPD